MLNYPRGNFTVTLQESHHYSNYLFTSRQGILFQQTQTHDDIADSRTSATL